MTTNKFFTTAFGGYIKVFLTSIIGLYIAEGTDLWSLDWEMAKKFIGFGVASVLPVIYNALNPQDPRYGNKKDKDVYIGKK